MPLRYKHCILVCRPHRAAPKPAKASPGTHTQLEAQSQGGFQKIAGKEFNPNKNHYSNQLFFVVVGAIEQGVSISTLLPSV